MARNLLLTICLLLLAVTAVADSFLVTEIRIEGNQRIDTASILTATAIQPGDQVTVDDIDQALHQVFDMGRFKDISAELSEEAGAKTLTFVVEELPLVRRIAFSGLKEQKEDKLRELLTIKLPEIYKIDKVKENEELILNSYREKGFRAAKIETKLDVDQRNQATLTFAVDEGEKTQVESIRFIGNTVFDEDELEDLIQTKERWWLSWLTGRGKYQEQVLQTDLERIKAAYQEKGYMDVKVIQPQLTLVEDKYLDVLIEIDEGPQYRVGAIDASGDLLKAKTELLELVNLQPGEIFNRNLVIDGVNKLTDLYADEGYANVNVAPITHKNEAARTIDLNLDIDQGIKVYMERIKIRGNTKTRDKVVRREVPLHEGDAYSVSKIKEANRRLRNLGFFEEVNISADPTDDPSKSILNIDVKEQPTGTFSAGIGYSSVDRLMLQGSVTQENFLGYGIRVRFSGSFGGVSTTYSLGVDDPHFLDSDWSLGGTLYKTEREYDDYDEYRMGGSIRAGHPIAKYTRGYLTYRYEEQEISDIDEGVSRYISDQEGDSTLSSITAEIRRNSTDYHPDPSRGGIFSLSLEYAGLGGTEKFIKLLAEHRQFYPLFWGTVFSPHGSIGYVASTNNDEVPIGERFFLGGINSIRGFKSREVGPMVGDDFIGGEKMAYANFELLIPIQKELGLKAVLFYDVGNAWMDNENYFADLRNSVGAGIRWISPLGPLRFEYGYNLSPRDDEKQSVFEFSIGTAF